VPKIVDHVQRRRELAEAAVRVIGRLGLDGATTQAVAAECGWSTGVLRHYFRNKDELLLAALSELERRNLQRFEEAKGEPTGYDAIRAAAVATIAGDRDETRVWISFLARASGDAAIAGIMRRGIGTWTRRWADVLQRGQDDGSIDPDIDTEETAVELYGLINGLRIGSAFGRASYPALDRGQLTFLEHLRADVPVS
jgi:AcrR family transcriptional regulator